MLNQQNDPEMGRNFWVAMILSMVIIFGYPVFLQWVNPTPPEQQSVEEQIVDPLSEELPQIVNEAQAVAENVSTTVTEQIAAAQIPIERAETYNYEDDAYSLEFSTLGATLTQIYFRGDTDEGTFVETSFYGAAALGDGVLGIRFLHAKEDLSEAIWKLEKQGGKEWVFSYTKLNQFRVTKTYMIDSENMKLNLKLSLENLSPRKKHFPVELLYGFDVEVFDPMSTQQTETVVWTEKMKAANFGKISKKGFLVQQDIAWAGAIKKYFAFLIKPDWKALSHSSTSKDNTIQSTLRMAPISLNPGDSVDKNFLVYVGTQRYERLKQEGVGFESILSKGFFGLFKVWLLLSLKFLNNFTHNYGFAIILLTVLIKAVFAPLTHMSFQSMKKMQEIQPKVKALQERYKKDPEKLNRETMELFKKNKVNPMAGCLPMLIQMPILFAMFRVLPEAIELKGAPFVSWITDLSQADQLFMLPFTVPFLGWNSFNLLPILMCVSQYYYQKTMPTASSSPEQQKIMNFMPILFGFICYNMPSGLVLYWLVQNILSMVQQAWTNKSKKGEDLQPQGA